MKRNFDFVSSAIESGESFQFMPSASAVWRKRWPRCLFGNGIGADVKVDEATLFDNSYGSIVVRAPSRSIFRPPSCWDIPRREESLTINGEKCRSKSFTGPIPNALRRFIPIRESTMRRSWRRCRLPVASHLSGRGGRASVVFIPFIPGQQLRLRHREGLPPGGCQ